ncbi:MAG: S9 family peptidase [Acidobacteriota bacterium]|nr:S9 family peptidase [Acidobacteriota bacterium]MDW3229522.1 S9 family peptidase [Acidobacteriota bacterium]
MRIKRYGTAWFKILPGFLDVAVFLLLILGVQLNLTASLSPGYQETKPELTLEKIMAGEDFYGQAPSSPVWAVNGKTVYFRWKKSQEKAAEIFAVSLSSPVPVKISREKILESPPVGSPTQFRGGFGFGRSQWQWDKTRKKLLVNQNGDIFLHDLTTQKTEQLTFTDQPERNCGFTFDQKKIYYQSGDNLFLVSLADHSLRQLTSFTREKPPETKKPDEIQKWYQDQQKELFKELFQIGFGGFERFGRGQELLPSLSQAKTRRKSFLLTENQRLMMAEPSPEEKYVIFMLMEQITDAKSTIVPNYVTRSGFTETITSHTKAAENPQSYKLGIMNTENGQVQWVDYGQPERQINPRQWVWSPDGKKCLLVGQSEDRKDAWIFLLDIASGKTSVLENIHDEAWVGELSLTNVFWWPDSRYVSYISEKSGYAHLYRIAVDGGEPKALTEGSFEVTQAWLSTDAQKVYFVSNEVHPGERHLYSLDLKTGKKSQLSNLTGMNEFYLSPDEKAVAIIHSYSIRPPELYLQSLAAGSKPIQITRSTTEDFRAYPWYDPEIITFKARDGVEIYARLFKPDNPHPNRPAVIFIHGAGYLQNADKGWSTYSREYMFHNLLRDRGYFILDVDYRGSSGYGRDFRTGIYRHMGGKDLEDVVDGAKFLVENYQVNPQAIGCYGGSYGGFLTLMAMFKTDSFRAGAALRPVTDWAHYHPGYTVNILNLPHQDPEAYKQSSPIYFAEGLKGALLICHGMVDTNVHFQDTVRLVQRLIELGKENWEVAIYPVENHSFRATSSWVDEYRRIFKLFENNLKR